MWSAASFAAQGRGSIVSPGARALLMSAVKLACGRQTPERSGLPSAVFGAGPAGVFGAFAASRPPLAGPWAAAAGAKAVNKVAVTAAPVAMKQIRPFRMMLSPQSQSAARHLVET